MELGSLLVNALPKELYLTIFKNGKIYEQSFKKGIPQDELRVSGESRKQGTKIRVYP